MFGVKASQLMVMMPAGDIVTDDTDIAGLAGVLAGVLFRS